MTQVHPTATIDEGAQIGEGTCIWHYSHVRESARIGENCIIGEHVYIGPNVVIGNGVKIQNNVSVYEGVTIEDDVFIGPSVVFTNVTNPRAFIERKNEFKSTLIKKGATLGANSIIICGARIGEYALTGAGSLISRDVLPFSLMVGLPACQKGWVTKSGKSIPLPNQGAGEYCCPISGQKYVLENGQLKCLGS